MITAVVVWLVVLVLVLELATEYRSGDSTDQAMTAHLVTTKVACGTSSKRT